MMWSGELGLLPDFPPLRSALRRSGRLLLKKLQTAGRICDMRRKVDRNDTKNA